MNKRILIIDSYSLLYKAFFGVRRMTASNGTPTNAVYGFISMLSRLIKDYEPDYVFAAFDEGVPTFRHEAYADYKAGRDHMPEDMRVQIPIVMDILKASYIECLSCEGYEADDVIGSVAALCEKNSDKLFVVTGDRDSFQLVSGDVTVLYAKRGVSNLMAVDEEYIRNEYSLTPKKMIDLKALMGDSSDNIPGVKGIGEKTALSLLIEYGSLDGVYENIENVKGKLKDKLTEGKENAYLSYELGTIRRDVPLSPDFKKADDFSLSSKGVLDILSGLDMEALIKSLGGETVTEERKEPVGEYEKYLPDIEVLKGKEISLVLDMDAGGAAVSFEGRTYSSADVSAEYIKALCGDESVSKNVHDLKSLLEKAHGKGIELKGFVFDTCVAAYVIDPTDGRYDLTSLAKKYLNVTLSSPDTKKQRSFFDTQESTFEAARAARQAECVSGLKELFIKKLEEDGEKELYENIEHKLIFVLAGMEEYGFAVDPAMIESLGREFDGRISDINKAIAEYIPEDMTGFNVNSTKQLGELLFERLGLPVVKKTKTGYSTDIDVLEKLKDRHPLIPLIIQQRQLAKLNSTYIRGLTKYIAPDGRIHSNFNQTMTATGRISSSNPNLQNIPIKTDEGKIIRKVFIPSDSDHLIVSADYSQIELRVLAHISGDENMIASFKSGLDIHRKTASEIFGVPFEEVTSAQRSSAKAVNFGIVYGISDYGLSQNTGISRKEAARYIETYLDKFPQVKAYMKEIVEYARENGYVSTMFGRRRYIPDIVSSSFTARSFAERTALNTPIQGSAADIIKIAMINVAERLEREGCRSELVLQVHDELIIDCLISEREKVRAILQEEMENAAELKVPLVAEVVEGNNWYEAK
ncbi:MAG: DNA polymerase I [Eubacteriales bacterium]|nr:DNA polymerase I [Eubacteriales bacterium]